MFLYKKQAFTLAETIMTLFIVGVVVMAAMPVFTTSKNNNNIAQNNTPWQNANNAIGTGLFTEETITINGAPLTYRNTPNGTTTPYNLTITNNNNSGIYNFFNSATRNIKIGNSYFYEDANNNLYISNNNHTSIIPPSNSFNNVTIGNTTINATITNNVSIGNNTIEEEAVNNTLFGNNIIANGDNSTGFGQNLELINNSVGIGGANANIIIDENAITIGDNTVTSNEMKIGNHITATGLNANPTVTFNGNVTINGTIVGTTTFSSDERLKNIKGKDNKGLKEILQITPVIFQYKDDKSGNLRIGVIAQDVQKIFPEAVVTMNNGYLGVNSAPMFFASINALKEINTQKNIEKARQEKLQNELEQLEKELAQLKPTFWDKVVEFFTQFIGGNHA